MPELPEVETIVRYLRPKIRGKRILSIGVYGKRVLRHHERPRDFTKAIAGKKIKDIRRAGKNIVFELKGGICFSIHLMMTGQLLLNPKQNVRHKRLLISLSGRNVLVFNDLRQFGWCRLITRGNLILPGKSGFLELNFGPDVGSLNFKTFEHIFRSRRGIIKSLLMNQKVISGIGNIYSDEILCYAGIRPMRKASSLSEREFLALYTAMKKVLRLATRKGGTSARDYRKPDGSKGGYYEIRRVYQREGEKCFLDGSMIKRIKVSQRSTHFCPYHQK